MCINENNTKEGRGEVARPQTQVKAVFEHVCGSSVQLLGDLNRLGLGNV